MPPADLIQFALAVVIFTAGLASVVGHLLRPAPKDRLLLWTGVFALVYGVRMFAHQRLASALGLPPVSVSYVENALNYFIMIPALSFTEELYGRGWKGSLRMLLAIASAYAVAGVTADLVTRHALRLPDPAGLILGPGTVIVFGLGALAGYRPPPFEGWRVLVAGLAVFVAFVLHEHAVNAGLLPTPRGLEPIGYLISLACLGYLALTRFFANARHVAANEREMQSAREIQASILPRELPSASGVEIAARYVPLAAVAGDFYDVIRREDGSVAVLVADASGHGVPAALIASMVKVAFVAESARSDDPASILRGMNVTLCGMFERAYVTAVCTTIAPAAGRIRYAIAGHPSPLLLSSDGGVRTLDERGMFIGVFPSAAYRTDTISHEGSARLILYTDGVTEAAAPASDDLFGVERLASFARAERHLTASAFADALLDHVHAFARTPLHDDLTLVVVDVAS